MKLPAIAGFALFCLLSGLAAWAAARAAHPPAQAVSQTLPSTRPILTERPPDPAWEAAAAEEFAWPPADHAEIEAALEHPRHASLPVITSIMGLPEDSAPALRAALIRLRGKPGREELMTVLMARWAALSPLEALEYSLTLSPTDAVIALIAGLPVWTRHNPAAALGWCLAKYREGQIPTAVFDAIPSIGWQWGRQDLPGVFTFLQGLDAMIGGESIGALREFSVGIGGLALQDDRRDEVLRQGLDFAASRSATQDTVATALLTPLAREKPAALAIWLDNQPDRQVPESILRTMVGQWSRRDPAAMREWIKTTARPLPGGLEEATSGSGNQ